MEPRPSGSNGTAALPSRSVVTTALAEFGPDELEAFVADLLEMHGWDTRSTGSPAVSEMTFRATEVRPGSEDDTALCYLDGSAPGDAVHPTTIRAAASHWLHGLDIDLIIVVSTGSFTDRAERLAGDLDVRLVDGDDLYRLLESADGSRLLEAHLADHVDIPDAEQTSDPDPAPADRDDFGTPAAATRTVIRRAVRVPFVGTTRISERILNRRLPGTRSDSTGTRRLAFLAWAVLTWSFFVLVIGSFILTVALLLEAAGLIEVSPLVQQPPAWPLATGPGAGTVGPDRADRRRKGPGPPGPWKGHRYAPSGN